MNTYLDQKLLIAGLLTGLAGLCGCGDDGASTEMDAGEEDAGMVTDADPGEDSGTMTGENVSLTCTVEAPTPGGGDCVTEAPTPPAEAGCPGDPSEVTVDSDITSDTTWSCDNTYVLTDQIFVQDGATLTIEPGTIVQGDAGANALVVTTTGTIDAEGTETDPIVFTSSNDEGSRAPGDWGGVVLLGNAPINVPAGTNNIEGIDPGESRGEYGGDDASHDCGTLKYVRIEWAGFVFGEDNELNGLTLGGCGSGTTLDFIQVHGGLDDGIEFFGGTANLKHAVVTSAGDDSLDTDQGYIGKVQYFVTQQDAAGNRGMEADNLSDDNDATPRSRPTVWNATFIGGGEAEQQGARWRRGTAYELNNAIFSNFGSEPCIRVDGSSSIEQANMGELTLNKSIVTGCADGVFATFTPDEGDDTAPDDATQTAWCDNNFFGVDPMLSEDATNLDAPAFMPEGGTPAALGAGDAPPDDGFFDADATWIGAIEPGCWDWTEGWTAYPAPAL